MDFELTPISAGGNGSDASPSESEGHEYKVSTQPLIEGEPAPTGLSAGLPRTYGTQTLCLMARDPRTLFAYWDIDWETAFAKGLPVDRRVHLLVTGAEGAEQLIEVEPMAGNCYVPVDDADAVYHGEIGFFQPAEVWNSLAASGLINTPPEIPGDLSDADFATVPFHLSFQRMVDMLRSSRQENETLTAKLADLRERFTADEPTAIFTPQERELARVVQAAAAASPAPVKSRASDLWQQQRLERILGFGTSGSSPNQAFGGSSPTR